MVSKLIDTFKQTADTIAFLDRGYGIGKPDVQSAIEKVYEEINRTNPTLEIVSVKDFGAKGDGVTDDTKSFSDAASYIGNRGGGILHIPNGTYKLSGTIDVKSNTIIEGQSHNTELRQTVDETPIFTIHDKNNVVIRSLSLYGFGYWEDPTQEGHRFDRGIDIFNSKFVVVENCLIRNFHHAAIRSVIGDRIIIKNNKIEGTHKYSTELGPGRGRYQFGISMAGTRNFVVDGNDISNTGQGIIGGNYTHEGVFHTLSYGHIVNNYIHDIIAEHGGYLDGAFNVTIANNIFHNCNLSGFKIQTSSAVDGHKIGNISVTGNVFVNDEQNGESAIGLFNLSNEDYIRNVTITGNKASNWFNFVRANGDCSNLVISGNVIVDMVMHGIYVSSLVRGEEQQITKNLIISDNVISGFGRYGVFLEGVLNAKIDNNIIEATQNEEYCIFATPLRRDDIVLPHSVSITNNKLYGGNIVQRIIRIDGPTVPLNRISNNDLYGNPVFKIDLPGDVKIESFWGNSSDDGKLRINRVHNIISNGRMQITNFTQQTYFEDIWATALRENEKALVSVEVIGEDEDNNVICEKHIGLFQNNDGVVEVLGELQSIYTYKDEEATAEIYFGVHDNMIKVRGRSAGVARRYDWKVTVETTRL